MNLMMGATASGKKLAGMSMFPSEKIMNRITISNTYSSKSIQETKKGRLCSESYVNNKTFKLEIRFTSLP